MIRFFRSTLQCFYNDSDCFQFILNTKYSQSIVTRPSTTVRPLINDTSSIVEQMMIEERNYTFSFDHYYETCLPQHCIYSSTTPAKDPIGIVLLLVSIIGGLTAVLVSITPRTVQLICRLLQRRTRKPRRGN